jgi:tetratricopeptide (TPR) repeat protein
VGQAKPAENANQYQAYVNLATVYQQEKLFAAAVEQLDHAIETATTLIKEERVERSAVAPLHRQRGLLQLDLQDPKAALQDLRRAIEVEPRAEFHAECGRILYGLQRFPDALLAYDAALKVDSDHADSHLGRAETLFKLEKYEDALLSLNNHLRRPDPAARPEALADVHKARGLTRIKLGHYVDAITDFAVALNLKEDSGTHAYRGWAYLVSKAPQLALPDFERAVHLDKHNSDAYIGRGSVRVKLGHYQEAIADAEKAVSLGPDNNQGNLCNAARIYAQVAAKLETERNPRELKMSAECREQALRHLREALSLTPASERASFLQKYIQADSELARFAEALKSGLRDLLDAGRFYRHPEH